MNRIDRLNAIRILLEGRRLITAQEIANRFDLSLRTVYRDLRSLQEAGIAVEGEAGVGYRLSRQAQLRPVSFSASEALSLLLAAKAVERHLDTYHHEQFASAMGKIRTALPPEAKDQLERLDNKIALPALGVPPKGKLDPQALHPIQEALLSGSQLQIEYHSGSSQVSIKRQVAPIGILYYGGYWHMIAWCRLRENYRDFRVDRIRAITDLGPHDLSRKLFSLDDYMQRMATTLYEGANKARQLTECVVQFAPSALALFERSRFRYGFVRQRAMDSGEHRDWVEASFYYDDLDDFARWLLSFTTTVHIVAPAQLQDLHRGHVQTLRTLLT